MFGITVFASAGRVGLAVALASLGIPGTVVGFVVPPEGLSSIPKTASTSPEHELILIMVISAKAPDINLLVIEFFFIFIKVLVNIKMYNSVANIDKKNHLNKYF
jgi:hypothetical protein